MSLFFDTLINWFNLLLELIDSWTFTIAGFNISWLSIMIAVLLISIFASQWWKGAHD